MAMKIVVNGLKYIGLKRYVTNIVISIELVFWKFPSKNYPKMLKSMRKVENR
jgi:hypothetical protein